MGVKVIIGGQFGSEGKGKTASLLSKELGENVSVVRCGGPNSGHIIYENDKEYCLRLLPSGVVYGRRLFLAPAAVIDIDVLKNEINKYQLNDTELSVDPNSVVITNSMKRAEIHLISKVASTGSGTGEATIAKILRSEFTYMIKDAVKMHDWLRPYVREVRPILHELYDKGHDIILEGTQGFGLSLHHSRMYPKTTSKDTTAAQFVMEAGLSPLMVDEILMVIRTFPIRVAGKQAGHLKNEISWEALREESGYPYDITEYTTVTKKPRRVGRFDLEMVVEACQVNRPTSLVVHGLDYLDYKNLNVSNYIDLTPKAKNFLNEVQEKTKIPIKYAFTGKANNSIIKF